MIELLIYFRLVFGIMAFLFLVHVPLTVLWLVLDSKASEKLGAVAFLLGVYTLTFDWGLI